MNDVVSKYKLIAEVTTTSFAATKPKLDNIFWEYGLPFVLRSDNGPPSNSHEFSLYCSHMGIRHQKITPEHPEANGGVEAFMKCIKKALYCARLERKQWRQELNNFLMAYRAAPHATTGKSTRDARAS